jgi:hypothetical protein
MATNLKDVIDEFNRWHQGGKGGQVPSDLKQKVIELRKQYSLAQLESCLGVKKATMRQWLRRAGLTTKSPLANHVDFVRLSSLQATQSEHCLGTSTLTVELCNGIKLLLGGQNAAELVELTSNLAKRLSA